MTKTQTKHFLQTKWTIKYVKKATESVPVACPQAFLPELGLCMLSFKGKNGLRQKIAIR